MPWCPKCRSEYREGFKRCAECEVDLVDVLPPEEEVKEVRRETTPLENPVELGVFSDNVEFMYVASMLDEMNIPYRVKTKGGATVKGIYTHSSPFKKYIFVEQEDYTDAEDVIISLDAYMLEDNFDEDADEEEHYAEEDYDEE